MPVPVVTVAQMREWEEQSWKAGRSQTAVIEQAGQLLARRALEMTRPEDRILVLAGKGHNGDDARLAQPHLLDRKVALRRVSDPAAVLKEIDPLLTKRPDLIIDGLFGIGLSRPLEAAWVKLLERINQAEVPVLAVDVPSGLNADTGEPEGAAIRAQTTLTMGAPKTGLLKSSSYPFVGRLEVAPEIGLLPCPFQGEQQWILPEDFQRFPPPRRVEGHKGSFGHLAIVAGSRGYHGAAVLAARGGLRAQTGLVSVFSSEDVYIPIASQLQAAMVHSWVPEEPLPESCSAVLIGPGLAARYLPESYRQVANTYWQRSPCPVVVDASALAWLAPTPAPFPSCRVITPHPGEAARMLGVGTADIQTDRVGAVRELAKRHGNCWVVLKGHQTLVGRQEGPVFFNSSGNPFLAQGGSGDALAGFLAGLLAQPPLQSDPGACLRYGVWQHGAAADQLSLETPHWTIEELLETLGSISSA